MTERWPMTPERLAEIRAACEAATPGPWEADLSPGSDPDEGYPNHGWVWPSKTYSDSSGDYMLWEDVQFCVLARSAIPELLAENARLRAEVGRLQRDLPAATEVARLQDAERALQAENARLRAAIKEMLRVLNRYHPPTTETERVMGYVPCYLCEARDRLQAALRDEEVVND